MDFYINIYKSKGDRGFLIIVFSDIVFFFNYLIRGRADS